jgi:hypothetical protein
MRRSHGLFLLSLLAGLAAVAAAPAGEPVPVLPPPTPLAPRAMTLQEFACAVPPLPGTYDVLLIHSRKGCPVRVCFTLPPGCPKVRVSKHEIEFDYGRCEVQIRCRLCGKITVDYDD